MASYVENNLYILQSNSTMYRLSRSAFFCLNPCNRAWWHTSLEVECWSGDRFIDGYPATSLTHYWNQKCLRENWCPTWLLKLWSFWQTHMGLIHHGYRIPGKGLQESKYRAKRTFLNLFLCKNCARLSYLFTNRSQGESFNPKNWHKKGNYGGAICLIYANYI